MMSDTKQIVADFEASLRFEGASANTITAYCRDLDLFLTWASVHFDSRWEDAATSWLNLQRQTLGAATVNRRAAALRRWFGTRGTAPLHRYRCPPAPPGEPHPLPGLMDDVRRMIEVAPHIEVKRAIAFMGYAGLRVTEARTLEWGAIKPVTVPKHGFVIVVKGKGGKTRTIPMSAPLLAVMADNHDPDDPNDGWIIHLSDRALREAVTKAGEDALIERPVASHDLRMTFGTVVWNATKDLRVVQELMGHSSSKTTERYTGVTQEAKYNAVHTALPDLELVSDGDS